MRQNITEFVMMINSRTYKRILIEYQRIMTKEFLKTWTRARRTGLKVSWTYARHEDFDPMRVGDFVWYNKDFVKIANIVQQEEVILSSNPDLVERDYVSDISKEVRAEKMKKNECSAGHMSPEIEKMLTDKYVNNTQVEILNTPDKIEITEKNLGIAANLYFSMVFCPERFYENLLENFPLETVLRNLARILLVSNEKKLVEHYDAAKLLFDKTSTLMKLQYRDIAVLTTGKEELQLYQDLKDHKVQQATRKMSSSL